MIKKFSLILLSLALVAFSGCKNNETENSSAASSQSVSETSKQPDFSNTESLSPLTEKDLELNDTSLFDLEFSKRDKENGYKQSDIKTPADTGDSFKISTEGVYIFTGDIIDKPIVVSAGDEDKIQIVLDNVNISNSKGYAIYIAEADKVFITATDNSENLISDGEGYEITDGDTNIDGAIFSRADLTLNGKGKLTVKGNSKHGIVSKDDLVITNQTLEVSSKNTALDGKDCVKILDADITINAEGDGIKSDNAEDEDRGFVYIESGKISVNSGNDGIQAEKLVKIQTAEISIVSGGGSQQTLSDSEESYKGIKSAGDIVINGGSFNISSKDDAVHSNHTAVIYSGDFTLSSGDDGIHADNQLVIFDGNIDISKCYEGLEASTVWVADGKISATASDDGINAAGGNDQSAAGTRPGKGGFSNGVGEIYISGGYIYINSNGDGIDSNGKILVSGGTTVVSSASNGPDSSLDYDGSANITGGVFVGLGISQMAMNFSQAENQGAVLSTFTNQTANTPFSVCNSEGNAILTFAPKKSYNTAVVSCPDLALGKTYTIVTGGTAEGIDTNGFAQNATHKDGITLAEIKLESLLYGSGGFGGGGQRPDGGKRPEDGQRPEKPNGGQLPNGEQFPNGGQLPNGGNWGDMPQFDGSMPQFDGSMTPFEGNIPPLFDESIPNSDSTISA